MRIEDSFRRVKIDEELEGRLFSRLNEFLAPFTPESIYAKNLRSDILALDLLKNVFRKEAFVYHLKDDKEEIYLIYKGEKYEYSTKIKKIISLALKELRHSSNRNSVNEVYFHIHINTELNRDKIEVLRRFVVTKNNYVFDRIEGKMLEKTYRNVHYFYELFSEELMYNEVIDKNFKVLREWLDSGQITEDQDLKRIPEMESLWNNLISLLPWPIKIPVEYDPNAKAPRWMQFLDEVLEKRFHTAIKRFIGYALYPEIISKLPSVAALVGEGSNGKSVFLKVIEALFGRENISHVTAQELGGRFAKVDIVGKLLNIAGDLPPHGIPNIGVFKQITGGDRGRADRKHKDAIDAEFTAKHIFSANQLPSNVSDKTYAFYRRWLIFIFPRTFDEKTADPFLPEKLLNELPGIFNWALEGYKELKESMSFDYPLSIGEIMDLYEYASNSLARFINEECEEASFEDWITFEEFYKLYSSYCKEYNLTPKADSVVGRELKSVAPYIIRDVKKIRGEKKRILRGVRVNYIPPAERQNLIAEMEKRFGKNILEYGMEEDEEEIGNGNLYIFKKPITIMGKAYTEGQIINKDDLPKEVLENLLLDGHLEKYGGGEGDG